MKFKALFLGLAFVTVGISATSNIAHAGLICKNKNPHSSAYEKDIANAEYWDNRFEIDTANYNLAMLPYDLSQQTYWLTKAAVDLRKPSC